MIYLQRARRAVSCKRKPDSDIEIEDESFQPNFKNENGLYFDLKELEELLLKLCEVLIFMCNNKRSSFNFYLYNLTVNIFYQ